MKKTFIVFCIIILLVTGLILYQNSYDMKQEEVIIQTKEKKIN